MLRIWEGDVVFLGDCSADGRSTNGYATGEEAVSLYVKKIAGPGSNIDDERRLVRRAVGRTVCVVESHRGDVHLGGGYAGCVDHGVDFLKSVTLNRNDNYFLVTPAFDEFVVPHNLVDGKRNVLLRLKSHDLLDIVVLNRREFYEASEDRLA